MRTFYVQGPLHVMLAAEPVIITRPAIDCEREDHETSDKKKQREDIAALGAMKDADIDLQISRKY